MRENAVGLRPGRGRIDQIVTLRQILVNRHIFRIPTNCVFIDLKMAFDSVHRAVLWHCLSFKDVPKKFISLIQSLHANSRSRVRAYGIVSLEFVTRSGVCYGCHLSLSLFSLVIQVAMEIALSSCENNEIDICADSTLSDLGYADDIMLLGGDSIKLQVSLDHLNDSAGMFGMRFASPNGKMVLQDWISLKPSLAFAWDQVGEVDRFSDLVSCISPDGHISDEVSSNIERPDWSLLM